MSAGALYRLDTAALQRDPFPALRSLRAAGPVVRSRFPLIGPAWLVTRYRTVAEVLKNHADFVQEPGHAGRAGVPGFGRWAPPAVRLLSQNMLSRDEPDHRRLRGLVNKAFQRHKLEAFEERVEVLCARLLPGLDGGPQPVDFVSCFARPLPLLVICELLGLAEADRPLFTRWMAGFSSISSPLALLSLLRDIGRIIRYLRGRFEASRRDPGAGLMHALVQAELEGDRLTEDELLAMVFLLFVAGHETTVHLLGGGLLALLEHPEETARWRADASLAETAVEELLRYVSAVQFTKPRYAARDLQLEGVEIRRGDVLMPVLAAANTDPERFPDPERLDLSRDPNPHLAFGSGIHFCLGAQLARMEARIAFGAILRSYPNLRLALPREQLTWGSRTGMRGMRSLPILT